MSKHRGGPGAQLLHQMLNVHQAELAEKSAACKEDQGHGRGQDEHMRAPGFEESLATHSIVLLLATLAPSKGALMVSCRSASIKENLGLRWMLSSFCVTGPVLLH